VAVVRGGGGETQSQEKQQRRGKGKPDEVLASGVVAVDEDQSSGGEDEMYEPKVETCAVRAGSRPAGVGGSVRCAYPLTASATFSPMAT
jgi:hypothetical protein